MTDNEIIKALECCKNADCVNCPRWSEEWYSGMCNDFLQSVLDLINRQKAENEAVRKDIVTAEEYAWKLKAKNEALQMDNEQLKSDIINERMNLEHIQAENEELEIKLKHFAEFLAEAEKKNKALISAQETFQQHIADKNAEISVKKKLLDKAEVKIEVLQMENEQLKSYIINANQNFDHIKELWEIEKEKVERAKQKVIDACKMLKTAKTEVVKEFAERLKKSKKQYEGTLAGWTFTMTELDNLVKEMVGEDE